MARILHVIANPKKQQSRSRELAHHFLKHYKEKNPNDTIIELDLYEKKIPHLPIDAMRALYTKMGKDLTPQEQKHWDLSKELIDQIQSVDKIVITTPMWNFSVPSILKAYLDYISVPEKTFRFTSAGPQGLLHPKKIIIIESRGGIYSQGPMKHVEMQGTYLKNAFAFLGINECHSLLIEGTNKPQGFTQRKEQAQKNAEQYAQVF